MKAMRVTVSVDRVDEQVEVPLLAGDVARRGVSIPHVVGRAPSRRVAVVDEFEPNDPGRQRVVGHDEPKPGYDHRFAAGPTPVPFEFVAEVVERDVEVLGVAADHVVGFGECAEGGAQRLEVGPPLLAEFGAPSALREQASGDPVDEAIEHLVDVGAGTERAHGRHRCFESFEDVRRPTGRPVRSVRGPSGQR